ncbi:MAG: PAS domain S-box protein, partial [Gemmatimonadota bacterium]
QGGCASTFGLLRGFGSLMTCQPSASPLGQELLSALPYALALVDQGGTIQWVNEAWAVCSDEDGTPFLPEPGTTLLAGMPLLHESSSGNSRTVHQLRDVIEHRSPRAEWDFTTIARLAPRQFRFIATAAPGAGTSTVLVTVMEMVTERAAMTHRDELFRLVIDGTGDAVFMKDCAGRYLLINSAAARALGRLEAEIVGSTDFELFPVEVATSLRGHDRLVMERDLGETFEAIIVAGSGTSFRLTSLSPFHDPSGAVAGVIGIGKDVTRWRSDEEALRVLQRQQAALLDNIPDMVWLKDVDSRFIAVNDALARACGRTCAEFVGRTDADIFPAETAAKFVADDRLVLERGERLRIEESFPQVDGTEICIETVKTPFRDAEGEWAGTAGIARDISDRRQAEVERDRIFTQLHDPVFVAGYDGFARRINPAFTRTFGWTTEDVLSIPWEHFIHRDDRAAAVATVARLKEGEEVVAFECRCRCTDGSYRWLLWNGTPWQGQGLFYAAGRDITERRRDEEALRSSEARLRAALDAAHLGFWDWNIRTGSMTFLGPPTVFFGPDSLPFDGTYESFLKCVHPDDRAGLYRSMSTSLSRMSGYSYEFRRVWPDGSVRWIASRGKFQFDEAGQAIGMLAAVMDVTDRRMLESQLIQAQKLEAIGQLAAGIAHEINTPTQYVGDNLRFLSDGFAVVLDLIGQGSALIADPAVRDIAGARVAQMEACGRTGDLSFLLAEIPLAVQQSLEGLERVAEIVRAMKDFSHPSAAVKRLADLNHSIENTVTVTRNEWKYSAEMVLDLDATLPPVSCHPSEIQQVIVNLIVNAVHAIADREKSGDKGVITISSTWNEEMAEIRVRDTGSGIPVEVRPRIFEPFFTTKEVGRGTGQGLAIAHDVIVKKHGGTLSFETTEGQGTTFLIRLPLHPDPDIEESLP